jgi:glutamate-1-semialdehyde 2,1-aminomutase
MYSALQKELEQYEKRTTKSRQAHERAQERVPIGVGSNYRFYPPYPLFVQDARGAYLRDLDGNEYQDNNLCYGALFAGHCHPAVTKAVAERFQLGTLFGMPHGMELELADEICSRFPVEMVRFGNSGSEVTMHSFRLARAVTGRSKIMKMEGGYHGGHDGVSVSVKPKEGQFGDPEHPTPVVSSLGVLTGTSDATVVAPFNNLPAVERLFEENRDQIAAVIVEPIMMNIAFCMPDDGYLHGLKALCTKYGALLILDEVKTGGKLAFGGACEYFNIRPDILCLGKSIGGGFSLAAFGASRDVMDVISKQKMFHAGTYNTNPVVMAAGLATFREVLTREAFEHVSALNQKLVDGYSELIKKAGLIAYADGAGANGALLFYPQRIRNYRDWYYVDGDIWTHYWFAMTNRGIIPQPYWWDEQWTLSVQHTAKDIDRHLEVFAEVAPALAQAQEERMTVGPIGSAAS